MGGRVIPDTRAVNDCASAFSHKAQLQTPSSCFLFPAGRHSGKTVWIRANLPKNITAENLPRLSAATSGVFNVCVTGLKSQSLYQERSPD